MYKKVYKEIYKEMYITEELICSWQNVLWATKTKENRKLLEVETVEIPASSFDCITDNIFQYHLLFCSVLS